MNLITNGMMSRSGRIKIQGSVTGSSSFAVPAGVTSVRLTGQGGAGVYNAGSPMTASPAWAGTITSGTAVYQSGGNVPYFQGQTDYLRAAGFQMSPYLTWNASGGSFGRLGLYLYGHVPNIAQTQYGQDDSFRRLYFKPSPVGVNVYANLYSQTPQSCVFVIPGWVQEQYMGGTTSGQWWADMNVTVSISGTVTAAVSPYYTTGTSTTTSSAQSTNGASKTWASHAAAGNPAAYDQYFTFGGSGGTVTYSVAAGTSLQYDYFLT